MNDWTAVGRVHHTVTSILTCLCLVALLHAGCANPAPKPAAAPAATAEAPSSYELSVMQTYRAQKEIQLAAVKPAIYIGGGVFIQVPPADALAKPPYAKDDSSASLHRKDLMIAVWKMDFESRRDALLRTTAFDSVVMGGTGEQPAGTYEFILSCTGTDWRLTRVSGGRTRDFARNLDMEHFAEQVVAAAREMAQK